MKRDRLSLVLLFEDSSPAGLLSPRVARVVRVVLVAATFFYLGTFLVYGKKKEGGHITPPATPARAGPRQSRFRTGGNGMA